MSQPLGFYIVTPREYIEIEKRNKDAGQLYLDGTHEGDEPQSKQRWNNLHGVFLWVSNL